MNILLIKTEKPPPCYSQRPFPGRTESEDRLAREYRLYYESAKTAAAEYLQTREQILNILETPPIMNGGHYLTKGHIILCLLYIKKSLMSRNILEPRKTVLSAANSPSMQGRSAPSTPALLDGS
jgi:hypothetical protein